MATKDLESQLGRRYSPDERDLNFMLARRLAPAGTPLPSRKTWAIKAASLDQKATGSCVGHAWANFLRCAPIKTNAGIDQLRWDIYDWATKNDEWTDNDNDVDRQFGTSIRAGAEAVVHMGRMKSYLWAFSLQPAVEWVLTEGPVVLGTNWYSSFMSPDKEGIVKITPAARSVGGHGYLWRGADTKRGLATCENSWGDSYAKSGTFYISFRDMERLIHEQGEVATAIEQKVKPL